MYEDLVREADKRRLKLSEEVERRLIHYEQMIEGARMGDDANTRVHRSALTSTT